jgi:hypothetical protein
MVTRQDAVTRGGKFWKLYKRPGHRVIVNADGDMIVRPTFIEASVQRRPGGASVAHHLLTSYLRSYIAVIKSQFSTKAFQGGREVRGQLDIRSPMRVRIHAFTQSATRPAHGRVFNPTAQQ